MLKQKCDENLQLREKIVTLEHQIQNGSEERNQFEVTMTVIKLSLYDVYLIMLFIRIEVISFLRYLTNLSLTGTHCQTSQR